MEKEIQNVEKDKPQATSEKELKELEVQQKIILK